MTNESVDGIRHSVCRLGDVGAVEASGGGWLLLVHAAAKVKPIKSSTGGFTMRSTPLRLSDVTLSSSAQTFTVAAAGENHGRHVQCKMTHTTYPGRPLHREVGRPPKLPQALLAQPRRLLLLDGPRVFVSNVVVILDGIVG